jgi:hypothetical protein
MSQFQTELKPAHWSLIQKRGSWFPGQMRSVRSEKIMFEQDDRAEDEGLSAIHSVFLTENAFRSGARCERAGCVLPATKDLPPALKLRATRRG